MSKNSHSLRSIAMSSYSSKDYFLTYNAAGVKLKKLAFFLTGLIVGMWQRLSGIKSLGANENSATWSGSFWREVELKGVLVMTLNTAVLSCEVTSSLALLLHSSEIEESLIFLRLSPDSLSSQSESAASRIAVEVAVSIDALLANEMVLESLLDEIVLVGFVTSPTEADSVVLSFQPNFATVKRLFRRSSKLSFLGCSWTTADSVIWISLEEDSAARDKYDDYCAIWMLGCILFGFFY